MPSTNDLATFPSIRDLRRLLRSLATLDAILSPEWEYRYYSFDSNWGPDRLMGSMRNGEGDHWFTLFSPSGVVLMGLAHEAPMFRAEQPWPGIWESLPASLSEARDEPAFDAANSTFCIWRRVEDAHWQRGEISFPEGHPDPDGSSELLHLLDGRPTLYRDWAADYYGVDVPTAAVERIYRHELLTDRDVALLNPELRLHDIADDLAEIGYPESSEF